MVAIELNRKAYHKSKIIMILLQWGLFKHAYVKILLANEKR